VLVEVDAQLLSPVAHLVAVDGGGEARLLELLLDRLGRQPVDALGAHRGTGHDEARQLVDGEQRLLHRGLAGHAQEVGVRGDRADDHRVLAAALELGHDRPRVAVVGVHVRMALVVGVVQEPGQPPGLDVLAALLGVGAHADLHATAVAAQRRRLHPLGQHLPGLLARHRRHGSGG